MKIIITVYALLELFISQQTPELRKLKTNAKTVRYQIVESALTPLFVLHVMLLSSLEVTTMDVHVQHHLFNKIILVSVQMIQFYLMGSAIVAMSQTVKVACLTIPALHAYLLLSLVLIIILVCAQATNRWSMDHVDAQWVKLSTKELAIIVTLLTAQFVLLIMFVIVVREN